MKTKWVLVVALISIGINLALAGFLLGRESRPSHAFDPTQGYAHWVFTLPQARQDELLPLIGKQRKHHRPLKLRRLHRSFREALSADPFDPERLATTLAELRAGQRTIHTASHESFVRLASELTLAERQQMAQELGRIGPRGRPHRGKLHARPPQLDLNKP